MMTELPQPLQGIDNICDFHGGQRCHTPKAAFLPIFIIEKYATFQLQLNGNKGIFPSPKFTDSWTSKIAAPDQHYLQSPTWGTVLNIFLKVLGQNSNSCHLPGVTLLQVPANDTFFQAAVSVSLYKAEHFQSWILLQVRHLCLQHSSSFGIIIMERKVKQRC